MIKVLMLTDHHVDIYNWRRELIAELISRGHKIKLAVPYGEKIELLKQMGCEFSDVKIDRRGKNIFKDLKLMLNYRKLIKKYKPDVVLTYGTKPNIYGGTICGMMKIPYIENINGLGSGITTETGVFEKFMQFLYKISANKAKCVFFQNSSDRKYSLEKGIVKGYNELIPGSGVNIHYFTPQPYPQSEPVVFTYIARIMKEKGIEEFLGAAEYFNNNFNGKAEFHILGFCEEDYEGKIEKLQDKNVIVYHGMQDDVRPFIAQSHCVVMPSFYGEGMSNTLLESAASGRPIITTELPGCGETVEDGITGYTVTPQSTESLINVMTKFLQLDNQSRENMGNNGREKMVKEFDRRIVVDRYLNQIEN